MLRKRDFRILFCSVLAAGAMTFSACTEQTDTDNGKGGDQTKDEPKSGMLKIDDKLFSVPSPIQTAFDIKQSGAGFNGDLLNDPGRVSGYSTNYQRAINMGVYGADLGYSLIYSQAQEGIKFLNSCQTISNDLGIASVFTNNLMQRFEKNVENQDSLLALVGEAYLMSDSYLKDSENENLGVLILAGGWIESLWFATNIAKSTGNNEMSNRVGQQKSALNNLLELFDKMETRPDDVNELYTALGELKALYSEVEIGYEYAEPTHFPDEKKTVINSRSEARMTSKQLEAITEKVAEIRTKIVG